MTRRITVPDDHVALLLPAQLADELATLLRNTRRFSRAGHEIVQEHNRSASPKDDKPSVRAQTAAAHYSICGDVILALLEAQDDAERNVPAVRLVSALPLSGLDVP